MSEERAPYDAGHESFEEGWAIPIGTTFAHYFIDGKSLCERWRYRGELEPIDRVTPRDCVMCLHELVKRLRKERDREWALLLEYFSLETVEELIKDMEKGL